MDKLANYGSDDDYEDSPRHKKTDLPSYERAKYRSQEEADVNYDEVQMDMSEDTDSSTGSAKEKGSKRPAERHRQRSPGARDPRDRKRADDYRRDPKDAKHRGNRDDRHKERYSRDKYREERARRRSTSRERERRSRSPPARRNDFHNKRPNSRDTENKGYGRKFEKYGPKIPVVPEKAQVEVQKPIQPMQVEKKPESEKDRFFMPGITGRFRDQIERRKLLWQKKDDIRQAPAAASTSTKVWQTTTFAQDTDGKVASKFKRLMGIRDQPEQAKQGTDVLKRQEEMFSSMEQQYEVARTATHTMRGVGLGFGSYQR